VRSLLLLTELAPVIGNDKASKIAHHAMDRDLMQTEDSIVGTGAGSAAETWIVGKST
jgi:fumarate hydratase class II